MPNWLITVLMLGIFIGLLSVIKSKVKSKIGRVILVCITALTLFPIWAVMSVILGVGMAPAPPTIRTGEFTYRFEFAIDDTVYKLTDTFSTEYLRAYGSRFKFMERRVWSTVYASGGRTFSYTILDTPAIWVRFSPPNARYLMGESTRMSSVSGPLILINHRYEGRNLPTIVISMEDAPEVLLPYGISVIEWYVSPRINNTFSRFRRQ